jgi:hypothetical protein
MFITLALLVLCVFLVVFALIMFSTVVGFWYTRVPFIRSKKRDIRIVLTQAGLADGQIFFDLGSGNGRVVFMAESLADVSGVGYELTFWAYYWAKASQWFRVSRAKFYRKNFFLSSWQHVDVFYCYLYPPIMGSVEQKFLSEAKPGAMLISQDFPLPMLIPVKVLQLSSYHKAYLYRKVGVVK